MERSQVLDVMGQLKLYGMKAAYDEIIATAVKRQHQPQKIVGDLLTAEISEKQARSIKYQMTIAKLPLAKEIEDKLRHEGVAAAAAWSRRATDTLPARAPDHIRRRYEHRTQRLSSVQSQAPDEVEDGIDDANAAALMADAVMSQSQA